VVAPLKGRSHCVRRRTTTYVASDVVRPRIYYVMQIIMPTSYKMATEDDVYDVVLASSIHVVIFRLLANFHVVEIDKLDLDASEFRTCCVVEMQLPPIYFVM